MSLILTLHYSQQKSVFRVNELTLFSFCSRTEGSVFLPRQTVRGKAFKYPLFKSRNYMRIKLEQLQSLIFYQTISYFLILPLNFLYFITHCHTYNKILLCFSLTSSAAVMKPVQFLSCCRSLRRTIWRTKLLPGKLNLEPIILIHFLIKQIFFHFFAFIWPFYGKCIIFLYFKKASLLHKM
jgi:hypothetical protein